MQKQAMNGDQYLDELNKRLRSHQNYQEGMAFEAYPPGSTGNDIQSIGWTQFFDAPGICAEIRNQLNTEAELIIPR